MSYTTVTRPHASQRVNPDAFCERVNGIWFVCLETSNDLMYSTSNVAIWAKAEDSETGHTGVVTYVGFDGTNYVRIRRSRGTPRPVPRTTAWSPRSRWRPGTPSRASYRATTRRSPPRC